MLLSARTVPKEIEVTEKVTFGPSALPVPVIGMVAGVGSRSSRTLNIVLRRPTALGVKETLMKHWSPARKTPGNAQLICGPLFGSHWKSLAFAPVMAMP